MSDFVVSASYSSPHPPVRGVGGVLTPCCDCPRWAQAFRGFDNLRGKRAGQQALAREEDREWQGAAGGGTVRRTALLLRQVSSACLQRAVGKGERGKEKETLASPCHALRL